METRCFFDPWVHEYDENTCRTQKMTNINMLFPSSAIWNLYKLSGNDNLKAILDNTFKDSDKNMNHH